VDFRPFSLMSPTGSADRTGRMPEVSYIVLLVFAVVLTSLGVAGLGLSWVDWHRQRRSVDHDPHPVMTPSPAALAAVGTNRDSERKETRLARRLIAGDLKPAQYHQRMADLAAQDGRGHPLVGPPDCGGWLA